MKKRGGFLLKRGKFKGFTLLELIIVVAIFAVIMFSVVQLIDPVSKFFVRSSNFESTNACVDNMTRAIEGNLKYADRVRAYAYFNPGDVTSTGLISDISTATHDHIEEFYNDFFKDRGFMSCKGTIHVLIFQNSVYGSADDIAMLNSIGTLSEYADQKRNSGRITHLTFEFDNYASKVNFFSSLPETDGYGSFTDMYANGNAETWYVNQKLYGNYDYRFMLGNSKIGLGADETTTTASATTTTSTTTSTTLTSGSGSAVTTTGAVPIVFDPSDFVIRIEASEIRKNNEGSGLIRMAPSGSSLASFTMKNVLDNTNTYSVPLMDTVLKAINPSTELSPMVNPIYVDKYMVDKQVSRFSPLQNGPDKPDDLSNITGKFDGFYFIYTLPDECFNLDQYAGYSNFADAFRYYIQTSGTGTYMTTAATSTSTT